MIDYDTFESIMGSKEAIYSATILASATAGYLLGRTLSKRKTRLAEIEQEKSVVHANIRQSELEAEAEKSRVSLEIKRLDYENADSRHQRMLEIIDKERSYSLEDKRYEEERRNSEHEKKISVAKELIEIKASLDDYLADLKENNTRPEEINESYQNEREKFRQNLVDEIIEFYDEQRDGFGNELLDYSNDVFDDETRERIENTVDAKFPLANRSFEHAKIPTDLKRLIDLLHS